VSVEELQFALEHARMELRVEETYSYRSARKSWLVTAILSLEKCLEIARAVTREAGLYALETEA